MTSTGHPLFPELTIWQAGKLGGWDSGAVEGRAYHFLHGNGFCARTLEPMARDLHTLSPAGQFLFTDLPGHGVAPSAATAPVASAGSFPDWNHMAELVAASLRQRTDRPVVGFGHSLGGVVTLLTAARYPELFERIILIDPVIYSSEVLAFQAIMRTSGLWQKRPFIRRVRDRQQHWPDRQTALESLRRKGLYRNWDPSALEAFVDHALQAQPDGSRLLACHPETEAAIFASSPQHLWRSVKALQCRADILVAGQSYPFIRRAVKRAETLNPLFCGHPVDGNHCVAMEKPGNIAAEIHKLLN